MKKSFLSISCLILISSVFAQAIDTDCYREPAPQGNTPQVFAPGIISLDNRFETYPTFSPDGNELFFTVVNANWSQGKILHSQKQNGTWSEPDTAIFSNNNYINWESFISPDGNRQFFASNRPTSSNIDIWMVERTSDSTWSDPVRLDNPVNSTAEDGSACVTNSGTLYFKSRRGGGIGGSWLYRSPLINGSYSQVESIGDLINTGPQETEPFMAPDESYLIFISKTRPGGYGGWDLWICFRTTDSSWTEPVNMGPDINTTDDEYGPRVSIGGNYLFFTRDDAGNTMDIYWVSSNIIDSLKSIVLSSIHPTSLKNIQIYPNPVNTKLNILFGTSSFKDAVVTLMDVRGRPILSETCHHLSAVTIDFTGKPEGLYILCIEIDGRLFIKKTVH
jgi:hypothetical protein